MEEITLLPPSDNWVFIGTCGYVIAYDVSTNECPKIWKTNLVGSGFGNVTMHCNKTTIFAGCGSKLYSLSTWGGDIQWEANLHGKLLDVDVRIAHDMLICGCCGYVTAVSQMGVKLWDFNLTGTGYSVVTTICVDNIIYATTNGYLFAISLDGQNLWKFNNQGQGLAGISLACIDHNEEKLLSLGMRGYLRQIDRLTGQQIGHSFCLKGTGYNFVVQLLWEDHLYIATNGIISAQHPSTFAYVWKNNLKGLGYSCGCSLLPYITSNSTPTIIVGFHGYVLSLHALSGTLLWKVSLPGTGYNFVSLCPTPEHLIAGTSGHLFLLNPNNGEMLGKINLLGVGHVVLGAIDYQMDQQACNLLLYSEEEENRNKN